MLSKFVAGIDVSAHRGRVDWPRVKASGQEFAYARATNGVTVDPTYKPNEIGAAAAGVLLGPFAYYRPDQDDDAQANLFDLQIGNPPLPAALDLEASGMRLDRIENWLAEYARLSGRRDTLIYTRATIWDLLSRANPAAASRIAANHRLWVAHYGAARPTLPRDWGTWTFWQHSESGNVPGVNPPTDLNWFDGTIEELRAMAGTEGDETVDIAKLKLILETAKAESFLTTANIEAALMELDDAPPEPLYWIEALDVLMPRDGQGGRLSPNYERGTVLPVYREGTVHGRPAGEVRGFVTLNDPLERNVIVSAFVKKVPAPF